MTSLLLLLLIAVSVTAVPVTKSSAPEESNDVDLPKRLVQWIESTKEAEEPEEPDAKFQISQDNSRASKKGRMHKAFFLNYPNTPQINKPSTPVDDYNDVTEERALGQRKKYQDSKIFYVRLPPSPYFFVPGLGYISNPPKFTGSALGPQVKPSRNQRPHRPQNSFINLPVDFVSNGKPTGVYQFEAPRKPPKRKDTALSKLRKGPYPFNGRPTSLYLLGPNGEETRRQPIIYSDVNGNNIY
ncbi:uncharacterized protein LOC107038196 [Diachasma alloeum]|uniref:uncharacterized protein LOC107038196 n=1 Tax=Diachasma alloeum TaxID=454923 RepID=UPI0007380FC5|nr:uncharacterized protein LOC107038196 [Diachasma alloeum]